MSLTQQNQQEHQVAMERAREFQKRLQVGITQTALAKELGISKQRLSQILSKYRERAGSPENNEELEPPEGNEKYEQLTFEFPDEEENEEPQKEPWECPTCGIQVQEGQPFCWKCGQEFDWEGSNAPK